MNAIRRPVLLAIAGSLALQVTAGVPVSDGKGTAGKFETPMAEANFGRVTLGAKFAEDLQSGYVDLISGGFLGSNTAMFLNFRGTFDDNSQQLFSAGLGVRHLFEGPGVIVGANVYYDYVDTSFGNNINQLGFGAEILTKWVDARFNYYLPENVRFLARDFDVTSRSASISPEFSNGNLLQRNLTTTTTISNFGVFEEGLEGWNAEAGFLVPGLEQHFDLRLFAGAYNYQDPKGGSIGGFRARAEARVSDGVTLDLEYWEDEELVGGNWVAGVRVSLPFDIGNLFTGRNPFEGAENTFRRTPNRDMRARMDEMVIRSHRVQTGLSGPEFLGSQTGSETQTITTGVRVMPPITPPPGGGNGEGEGQESPEGFGEF